MIAWYMGLAMSLVGILLSALITAMWYTSNFSSQLAKMSAKIDGMIDVAKERHNRIDASCAHEQEQVDDLEKRVRALERTH